MRKTLALASTLLILMTLTAGCTVGVVMTPGPPPIAPSPTAAAPVALATGSAAPTGGVPTASDATPAGAAAAVTPVAVPPADRTKPAVSITIDPPEVAWDDQAVVTVRASDPAGIKELAALLGDQVLATGDGEELQFDFIPGAIDGLAGGQSYDLVARATDLAGNTAEAHAAIQVGAAPAGAVPATATPAAAASPQAASPAATVAPAGTQVIDDNAARGAGEPTDGATTGAATTYRVTEINLPAYPYAAHLSQTTDPEREDYPVLTLDREAYEASNPQPQMKPYRLLVLENRYLRLGILPDLGGRIYECIFKPTGANEFYSNTVIKPTKWGPGSPPYPEGAAWWTAAGGLEWGFPVEEHGYEFGTVWGFDHAAQDNGGVMITVFTKTGPEKPYAVVDIILPPDTAYFVVQPRVVNPLGAPFKFKFWENAMLAPGKANSVSPDLRLIFPAQQVTVHSTGDPSLPQAGQTTSWPVINGRDLSRLGNWTGYLGVFAAPVKSTNGPGAFAAVYDPSVDEGMVRVFPADVAKGVKLFAPRGSDGLDPALWTDDGSSYVELHGGFDPDYATWHTLEPGEEATWSEFWYPVAKIGGVTYANDRAALSLTSSQGAAGAGVRLGLFPTSSLSGRLTVTLPGAAPVEFDVQLSPDQPLVKDLPLAAEAGQTVQVAVALDAGGAWVFEWAGPVQLR